MVAIVKIEFHGDSTQAGAELVDGVFVTSPNRPSDVVFQYFNAKYPGRVVVENLAIGGSRIAQCYWGQAPYTQTWAQRMAASQAHIVVVNHGINDAFIPGMTGTDYRWCANMMSSEAQAAGKQFFIETPNPITASASAMLASFVANLNAGPIFSGTKKLDSYSKINTCWDYWKGQLPDGVHPNSNMYKWKGDMLIAALEPSVIALLA